MAERTWFRPDSEAEARAMMIDLESKRDWEGAALAAIAYADYIGVRAPEGAAGIERQAQVYATLSVSDTILFVAENRVRAQP